MVVSPFVSSMELHSLRTPNWSLVLEYTFICGCHIPNIEWGDWFDLNLFAKLSLCDIPPDMWLYCYPVTSWMSGIMTSLLVPWYTTSVSTISCKTFVILLYLCESDISYGFGAWYHFLKFIILCLASFSLEIESLSIINTSWINSLYYRSKRPCRPIFGYDISFIRPSRHSSLSFMSHYTGVWLIHF